MPALKVRKIDFQFSNDMPFQAFPDNPQWGNFVNVITLIAPAFERYFIRAFRNVIPHINDEKLKKEAVDFCAQEAQHSKHHLAHMKVLAHHYAGLAETEKKIKESYEQLFTNESAQFHLSYAATVELTFGPIAKFAIENRQALFKNGDTQIASFLLWHLVEEFEHRNAALDVYNEQVGSYFYRIKTALKVFTHIYEVYQISLNGFKEHVYANNINNMPLPHQAFDNINLANRMKFFYHLLCTLLPYHKPDNLQQPEWVTQWFADENNGVDMRYYFPNINA